MTFLSPLDYFIIFAFLAVIVTVGMVMSRKASKNLENYFLGGRKLPWYMLGITGMSGWFDLTGTMIITSFLYMLGPLGLYIEFRGGAVLVLAFMLAYTGKWHRRSGCMTNAEWMTYRFGTGFSGELLRLVNAIMGIVVTIGALAYLVRGATLFMGIVFPVDPILLTVGLLGLASLYTVLAGFYGVVLTDLVQGVIMIAGCFIISIIAWNEIPNAASLSVLAQKVTGNSNWVASAPSWHVQMPKGYEAYQLLIMAASFYLLRNVLGGMGSGGESRFFAARNPREASMQCLLQGLTVMFRWPLMISLAILGLILVSRILPDREVGGQVAQLIQESNPTLVAGAWHGYTSSIAHHPESAPPEMLHKLKDLLGPNWQAALLLVSPQGTVDPELILPAVLLHSLNPGLRGIIIVSLLAAMMGALTGVVNSASALFVRDIYQNFLRPNSGNRELVSMAYLSSAVIIVISFAFGLAASSINGLWSWLIMGLASGALGPTFLRLYWWRANAWGMAMGFLVGCVAAIFQRLFFPQMSEWWQFTAMTLISFGASIAGSLMTPETPHKLVRYFYHTTRPFGFWRPFWKELPDHERLVWRREHRNDIIATIVTLVWQVCLFLLPMQLLTRNWEGFATTSPVFLLSCIGLYFFWWKNLPSPDEEIADFASNPPLEHAPLTAESAKAEMHE